MTLRGHSRRLNQRLHIMPKTQISSTIEGRVSFPKPARVPLYSDSHASRSIVYFIMGQFAEAAENYTKSMALDDMFVFSHIQLAVAQYKSENLSSSMATFRRTLKKFPQRSEPQNY